MLTDMLPPSIWQARRPTFPASGAALMSGSPIGLGALIIQMAHMA